MPCEIIYSTEDEDQKSAFAKAFEAARQAATQTKNNYEREYLGLPGTEPVRVQHWIKKHYDTAGQLIGARRRVAAIMAELKGYSVVAGDTWSVSLEGLLICTVRVYVPKAEDSRTEPECCRLIYKIRSKDYILDDAGTPTRRFAFCVRGKQGNVPLVKPIPALEVFGWRFTNPDHDLSEAMRIAVDAIGDDQRNTWHTLSPQVKICLAYLNYANNGRLGLCLSSTPKRIRDNGGKAFVDKVGYDIWKVDLAKIPTTCVLINLYGREPATEGWTAVKQVQSQKKNNDDKPGEWISQGTVKNRELFCSGIPEGAAVTMKTTTELVENDGSWKAIPFFMNV